MKFRDASFAPKDDENSSPNRHHPADNKNRDDHFLHNIDGEVMLVDADGRILFVNDIGLKAHGVSESDVIGRNQRDLMPKEVVDYHMKVTRNIIATGETVIGETKSMIKGEWHWFRTTLQPFKYRSDRYDSVLVTVQDLTELKAIDRALRDTENISHLLVENLSQPIGIMGLEGEILGVSKITASYFNCKPEDLIGKNVREFISKARAETFFAKIRQVMGTRSKVSYDFKSMLGGRLIYFDIDIYPVQDSDGSISKFLVIGDEITARKRNEIREKARLELLNRLSTAGNIRECLKFGCRAMFDGELFRRSLFVLLDENDKIAYLGSWGFDPGDTRLLGAAEIFNEEFIQLRSIDGNNDKERLVSEHVLPEFKPRGKTSAGVSMLRKNDRLRFFEKKIYLPMNRQHSGIKGWLMIDSPFEGGRPDDNTIDSTKEIADIVLNKISEIKNLEILKAEREAFEEKNIALKEVLAHIEEEKLKIRKQVAENVDRALLPALRRLVDRSGIINTEYYNILEKGLEALIRPPNMPIQISSRLTPRESEICNLIRDGATSKIISSKLHISLTTVKKHREAIRRKLGLSRKQINLMNFLRNA
jgi:PAS domain S-box-containing protein